MPVMLPSLPVKAVLIEHIGRVAVKPETFIPIDDVVVTFTHAKTDEQFVLLTSRIIGLIVQPEPKTEQPGEQAAEEAAEDRKAA
ncbi:hypothetical protein [Nonomuraea sp. NPDC023979]|uniref:hypothetical protein n=1 Tax=Nonomuraea sp. NPDC023979 TaxID=3154796 RepID=UPI0033E71940